MEHAGHGLCVLGAPGGQHGHLAEPAEVLVHALLDLLDLLGQVLLVEEDGRVGQVDHELGRVLELDQQFLDVLRLLFVSHA